MAKTTAKKASASTEQILGQAAQQITKAVAELNAATATVNELTESAEALTLQVANKEQHIQELDVQFEEKKRQLGVDLDLSFKASTDRVVTEYLNSVKKVAIPAAELSSLQKELADTKAGAEAETKKQVAAATGAMKSHYEQEIKLIHSENNTKSVENKAKIDTLAEKALFLETQVTKLYSQLDAERAAGTERAKAGSVGSINVGESSRK